MKKLCKECPEQKYCTEACLESIVAEQVVSEALENKGNVQQAIKNAIKKHQE